MIDDHIDKQIKTNREEKEQTNKWGGEKKRKNGSIIEQSDQTKPKLNWTKALSSCVENEHVNQTYQNA